MLFFFSRQVLRPCSVVLENSLSPSGPLTGSVTVDEVIVKVSSTVYSNSDELVWCTIALKRLVHFPLCAGLTDHPQHCPDHHCSHDH